LSILLATIAVVSAFVAIAALWTTRSANTRRDLSTLRAYLDSTRLDIAMWRMDMMTRTGRHIYSIEPCDLDALRMRYVVGTPQRKIIDEAVADDWESPKAGMFDTYYFAIRVYEWLQPDRRPLLTPFVDGMRQATKVRLLNEAFAHQLLTTFLDHRIVACRLRGSGRKTTYFATHYGIFDSRYSRLVEVLYADLEERQQMTANLWMLPKRRQELLDFLASNEPAEPPLD
jgi:hypothetical protein